MLTKIQIRTSETDSRKLIVRTLFELYPYKGVIQEEVFDDQTRYTFLTDNRNLKLIRHDLRNLKTCGFHAEGVKVL